jgi:ABC-type transport system involved in multi-copper enzyme maturation permease subunit
VKPSPGESGVFSAERRSPRFATILLILTGREALGKLGSIWFSLVASSICLIAFVYGSGFQQSFVTESVLVTPDPLAPLNVLVIAFIGVMLGLRLATSLAWEREHHTLEVLVVGPAPWSAIVLSKFIAELGVMAALFAVYFGYLLVGQPLGPGVVHPTDAALVLVAPICVLPLMAAGLFVSSWAGTVRGAVVVYLAAIGGLAAFETLLRFLKDANPAEMSLSSIYLRSGLEIAARVVSPVSPVSQLASMIGRVYQRTSVSASEVLTPVLLTGALLLACYASTRYRGALA